MNGRIKMLEPLDEDTREVIGAPMDHDDLNELVTLLYRAKGECYRRGLPTELFSGALGMALALLTTLPDLPTVRTRIL